MCTSQPFEQDYNRKCNKTTYKDVFYSSLYLRVVRSKSLSNTLVTSSVLGSQSNYKYTTVFTDGKQTWLQFSTTSYIII